MGIWLEKDRATNLIKFYRENPALAAQELLNVDLYNTQRVLLENMWFKNFVIIVASRGAGKTYMQAVFAGLTAMLYPGHRVGFVSASFRQAKFMMQELERLYKKSPIMQQAAPKGVIHGADSWSLDFTPPSNLSSSGSWIEAVPLGKGDKIRGARFHTICIDEMGSVPEDVFKMVIKPMAATTANPMVNVRRQQEEDRLVEMGLVKKGELTKRIDNRIIMTSSGNFKFNHLYTIYKEYREQMDRGNDKYYAARVPYNILPKNFLSDAIVEDSKNLSSFEFKMEYEAGFISDSDGVFKASLLSKQTSSIQSVEASGQEHFRYILAVDPAREESAATAIIIVKVAEEGGTVVYAKELFSTPFPDQSKFIKGLCRKFNISAIYIDAGGGGKAIRDLLYESRNEHDISIIDHDDHNATRAGLRILHMVNFSPEWIGEANYQTLSLLEKGKLWFPAVTLSGSEEKETMHQLINKIMKNQISSIVVTQTRTGKRHFDTPSAGQMKGAAAKNRKDLYSCFIMVGFALYNDLGFFAESKMVQEDPILLGIIRPIRERKENANDNHLNVPTHFKERFENGRFFK